MRYDTGTVAITEGSSTVTGTGTAWVGSISAGEFFFLEGLNRIFQVAAIDSDTQLKLSTPVDNLPIGFGTSGLTYLVAQDFTPRFSIPYPRRHDTDSASVLRRATELLDRFFAILSS